MLCSGYTREIDASIIIIVRISQAYLRLIPAIALFELIASSFKAPLFTLICVDFTLWASLLYSSALTTILRECETKTLGCACPAIWTENEISEDVFYGRAIKYTQKRQLGRCVENNQIVPRSLIE
jgi:hypothetical protein